MQPEFSKNDFLRDHQRLIYQNHKKKDARIIAILTSLKKAGKNYKKSKSPYFVNLFNK